MKISVKSLHVYPVKSLRGINLQSATLLETGLQWDRHWLLVDAQERFLSQRRLPAMAGVTTLIGANGLVLRHDEQPDVHVPFDGVPGRAIVTEVWGDRCEVVDQGDEVAAWMSAVLGKNHAPRLVRMANGYQRPQAHPERYGVHNHTLFADSAPFLVANSASLVSLNQTLVADGLQPVTMDRFRPNIVIDGLDPFSEHQLASLKGPGYELEIRYPRERCVITTMDQQTGKADPSGEPFRTLRRINPMPGDAGGPAFAELAVLGKASNKRIRVGDALKPGWK